MLLPTTMLLKEQEGFAVCLKANYDDKPVTFSSLQIELGCIVMQYERTTITTLLIVFINNL